MVKTTVKLISKKGLAFEVVSAVVVCVGMGVSLCVGATASTGVGFGVGLGDDTV